ncbi:hypothetical protein JH129_003756, partial [Acinetobacter baumannii]
MGHVDYDSTLIVGSFIAAGAICYIVISMEQLIFKQTSLYTTKIDNSLK